MKKTKHSTWGYGIIYHDDSWFLHEIYFDDGEVTGWTADPVSLQSETPASFLEVLRMVKGDVLLGEVFKIKGKKLVRVKQPKSQVKLVYQNCSCGGRSLGTTLEADRI